MEKKYHIFKYVETEVPKFRNWLPTWDVQVLWEPHLPSNLCPHSLVHPVIQLLFKSSHSLLNVFAKFKPILPAGVNHSCSIIPAEKLSKEVSQIPTEASGSGFLLAGARTGVATVTATHPLSSSPTPVPLPTAKHHPARGKKRGMCSVFQAVHLAVFPASSKIMPGSCKHKKSLIAVKKIRPLR